MMNPESILEDLIVLVFNQAVPEQIAESIINTTSSDDVQRLQNKLTELLKG